MHELRTMLVICIACLGIFGSTALAEPALVIKEDGFTNIFDGDGGFISIPCEELTVVTNSETGVILFRCRGQGMPNSSGRAVKYDLYNNPIYWQLGIEISCGFFLPDGSLVFTKDFLETISASGNFSIRCKAKID